VIAFIHGLDSVKRAKSLDDKDAGEGKTFAFDITIVSNKSAPNIPVRGKLCPLKEA
jgi:hypothetical protein